MLRVFCALVFLGLTSCSSNPVAFLAPTVISQYLYDRTPISFMAEFLARDVKIFPFMRHPKGVDQINKLIFTING